MCQTFLSGFSCTESFSSHHKLRPGFSALALVTLGAGSFSVVAGAVLSIAGCLLGSISGLHPLDTGRDPRPPL